jgi:hypothetical protein
MSSLTFTTSLVNDSYHIQVNVTGGSQLPSGIFVYENSGTNLLGKYYGICSLAELTRLTLFTGEVLPVFGNRFVRSTQADISVPLDSDIAGIIATISHSVRLLNKAYTGLGSVTSIVPL